MEIIKEEFKVNYEILQGCLIRSSNSGVIQQTGLRYNASVRLSCRNVYEVFNEKTNFTDTKETNLTFKIPCVSDSDAGILAMSFKNYFKTNKSLIVTGSLPSYQNNEYSVNIDMSYDELMKILNSKNKAV